MGDVFGGGKSGGGSAAPTYSMPSQQGSDMEAIMEMMMMSMEQAMAQQAQMAEAMQQTSLINMMPDLPSIFEGPDIDWTEKNEQLKNQAAGSYNVELARKKGLEDTVFSVLSDDEPVKTTNVLG